MSRYLAILSILYSHHHNGGCQAFQIAPYAKPSQLQATKDSWSIADDWEALSSASQENSSFDSATIFNQHPADHAAKEFQAQIDRETKAPSSEDVWLTDVIEEIYHPFTNLEENLYDTGNEDFGSSASSDEIMDQEIAMLVRCNEQPGDLLINEGRAIAPLSEEELNDPFQLVQFSEQHKFQPTQFLKESISIMFNQHATPHEIDGVLSLDRTGVAKWMTRSLSSDANEGVVSAHDNRVQTILSEFSRYGSGRLETEDFKRLYVSAIVGDASKVDRGVSSSKRHLQFQKSNIDAVWRDIRNHGLLSPSEQQRKQLTEQLEAKRSSSKAATVNDYTVMDECEILDFHWGATKNEESKWDKSHASGAWSSHEGVEKAKDKKTPLRIKDGEFVFIDEDSCIGCMQCVNVAPSAFMMLDTGRARTFSQRSSPEVDQAVASCPVDCMHSVTFRELKEFEDVRDKGDGRSDHKYLGRKLTPLHVVESDHNRRSSWYHTLKHKCLVSSECPQKGCYDCPKFSNPGDNPYFQKNCKDAQHTRALHFIENGDADSWRKTADL